MRLPTSALVLGLALLLATAPGCKRKRADPSVGSYKPPPRRAYSVSSLSSLCDETPSPFDGAPAYVKNASADKPSKLAAFRRYTDDKTASYGELSMIDSLGAVAASDKDAAEVELVACIDTTKETAEPGGHCGYYGGDVKLFTMKHKLRVLEAKTGRKVLENELVLDQKTTGCPDTYAFAKGSNSVYDGADVRPKLGSLVLPLEPEGVKLPAARAGKLDAVCSGGALPQAAPYVPGTPTLVHKVYFPDPERSFTTQDPPRGMPELDDFKADAAGYALVACITGHAKKKRRDCEFTSGKVLTISDGEFEVRLLEARTGKLVETKSFKGSSPDGCPTFHKFWGKADTILTRVEPALGKYLSGLEGRAATATASSARAKK